MIASYLPSPVDERDGGFGGDQRQLALFRSPASSRSSMESSPLIMVRLIHVWKVDKSPLIRPPRLKAMHDKPSQ